MNDAPPRPPSTQELEAPPVALALWRDAARELGASSEQAAEAARTGVIEFECRDVVATFSADDGALVLSTALPAEWLDDETIRHHALRSAVPLMVRCGVTIARIADRPALLCRWSLRDGDAPAFAAWLREFAAMSNLVALAVPELADMAATMSASPSHPHAPTPAQP